MADRPHLHRLADRMGILPEYLSYDARERRVTSDRTREAILAALGFDASSEQAAKKSLEALDQAEASRLLEPFFVAPTGSDRPPFISVKISQSTGVIEWRLEFHEDGGRTHSASGQVAPMADQEFFEISLPVPPDVGCHEVHLRVRDQSGEREGRQLYIVAPSRCVLPGEKCSTRQAGIWTSLYTIRSNRNWGCGDLTDLRELLDWCADCGSGFIAINPLHATRNEFPEISPYRPTSRLFRNPIYIDVESIPEFAESADARALAQSLEFSRAISSLRSSTHVDYARVWATKLKVLRLLHRAFQTRRTDPQNERARQYGDYKNRHGTLLTEFATYQVLHEHFRERNLRDWHEWSTEFRNPKSSAVTNFSATHADEIDFHCYLQFEVDRQLHDAAKDSARSSMQVGIINDLAIGTAPFGFDLWAFPELFVEGVDIGAPPDDLGPTGQNWGLPPLNPLRLRESGYAYWRSLLKSAFVHAGAVRIDHVMGLLRQFWIPRGFSGTDGAYLKFPADEMFAILAVESHRHSALVIGEDLGTLPEGFRGLLERWGVLSTEVLYFERDFDGAFHPPAHYSSRAFVTVNTHDMVLLAGYAEGNELKLRRKVGIIRDERELEIALVTRRKDFQFLIDRLREEKILDAEQSSYADLLLAVSQFLSRTPAPLVAVSLDDLAGETEPVNVPGVGPDQHPSWSRRMRRTLEELRKDAVARAALETLARPRSSQAGSTEFNPLR